MKTINLIFEENKAFKKLYKLKMKSKLKWEDFLLSLVEKNK